MADKEKNAGQEAAVKKAKKAANADSTKSGKGKKDGKDSFPESPAGSKT